MAKVVDITFQVTCLQEDVETVKNDLKQYFCNADTALVQRPKTGGMKVGKPRPMRKWMKETLSPE